MCMTSAPCSDARFYSFFGAAFREQARKLRDGRHSREAASFPWEGNGFAKVDAAFSRVAPRKSGYKPLLLCAFALGQTITITSTSRSAKLSF
jgi:hypothetical protein